MFFGYIVDMLWIWVWYDLILKIQISIYENESRHSRDSMYVEDLLYESIWLETMKMPKILEDGSSIDIQSTSFLDSR